MGTGLESLESVALAERTKLNMSGMEGSGSSRRGGRWVEMGTCVPGWGQSVDLPLEHWGPMESCEVLRIVGSDKIPLAAAGRGRGPGVGGCKAGVDDLPEVW